jgi:hypothetical protein
VARLPGGLLIKAEELTEVQLAEPTPQNWIATLTIETTNEKLPRGSFATLLRPGRIAEIHGRLKAIQAKAAAVDKPSQALPGAEGAKLENAIRELTQAVSSLTEIARQLASEIRNSSCKGSAG